MPLKPLTVIYIHIYIFITDIVTKSIYFILFDALIFDPTPT